MMVRYPSMCYFHPRHCLASDKERDQIITTQSPQKWRNTVNVHDVLRFAALIGMGLEIVLNSCSGHRDG